MRNRLRVDERISDEYRLLAERETARRLCDERGTNALWIANAVGYPEEDLETVGLIVTSFLDKVDKLGEKVSQEEVYKRLKAFEKGKTKELDMKVTRKTPKPFMGR